MSGPAPVPSGTGRYDGLADHDFSPWGLRVIVQPTVRRKEGSPITAFSKNRPLQALPLSLGPPTHPGWSPAALTVSRRDRDVGQRRILLGAVPVFLTSLDMHYIPHCDLPLFMLGRHDATTTRHYENLIAAMSMPPGRSTRAKIDDATAIVVGRVIRDDGLPCPCH